MSDGQAAEIAVSVEDIFVSPAAAAILEFTSNIGETRRLGELTYITSKDAFIWSGRATLMARYSDESKPESLENIAIQATIYGELRSLSRLLYNETPFVRLDDLSREIPSFGYPKALAQPPARMFVPFRVVTQMEYNKTVSEILISKLLRLTNATTLTSDEDAAIEINKNIQTGYAALQSDELISDPVIETALALAILPFVPFSIVKRTKKGQTVYRKIQAGLWKYERTRQSGGRVQTNLTFEAARIAKAIKVGLTAAFHEATKGAGDEPEE